MTYEENDYSNLLGMEGFSNKLLEAHFKLYSGYVKNTNKSMELIKSLEAGTPEWAEVKRRFGWEFNGMRLHELYFGNMSNDKKTLPKDSALFNLMVETFGSGEGCHNDFVNTGKLRGIGWVVMAYDPIGKKLFNTWINEHDVGHLVGAIPLLVMDVFEHAFVTDFGMDRASYIKAFVESVDWETVQERFRMATE